MLSADADEHWIMMVGWQDQFIIHSNTDYLSIWSLKAYFSETVQNSKRLFGKCQQSYSGFNGLINLFIYDLTPPFDQTPSVFSGRPLCPYHYQLSPGLSLSHNRWDTQSPITWVYKVHCVQSWTICDNKLGVSLILKMPQYLTRSCQTLLKNHLGPISL